MTKKDIDTAKITPPTVSMGDDKHKLEYNDDQVKLVCGTANADAAMTMLNQAANAQFDKDEDRINAAIALMAEIHPKDGLEGMLASQMVAVHNMAMECASRAMLPDNTVDGVNSGINRTTKLMRTFTAQMEALQRYRNGGKQKITVQHVNVEDGGQAIVGDVHKGEG
ncbi:hypothetical protein JV46_25450 [Solemya velum gill symbiont]|uniref:Uncharacterized protein n=1 Tax=Solemya velum gill symbiont TaxID=2340 RepID=A0A0B0H2S2_SOVGS|nr:hypothetical protein [Solemya velum gill symbiont]KHF24513.1 hypothetical protein JV46_25450 [Solemya velum gill symbiont]